MRKEYKKIKEAGDSGHTDQNELDKSCFQHDITYGDFKDLPWKKASDKVLRYEAFNITKTPKYDGCQSGLAPMVYKFLDKKSATHKGTGINSENR